MPDEEYTTSLVRIKDGMKHGGGITPAKEKSGGDMYVAVGDEVMSFGDKFTVLDHAQTAEYINGTTIDKILALADDNKTKSLFLIEIERAGKQRTTLIDSLLAIVDKGTAIEEIAEKRRIEREQRLL